MNSYAIKLRDPRWQKKRLEVLNRAGWECEMCGDKESTLHVHHKQYFKGREPWEYDDEQLSVLCECCHAAQHEGVDLLLDVASRVPVSGQFDRHMVAYVVAGMAGLEMEFPLPAMRQLYELGAQLKATWCSGGRG